MGVRPSRLVTTLAVAVGVVLGAVGLAGAGAAGVVKSPSDFPANTIIEVSGDKANGFAIRRLDGTEQFPPTDSEARAECSEYDTQVARIRCRTEVRTWYRDLGELQAALDYAHSR
jgi:hypothetical protein